LEPDIHRGCSTSEAVPKRLADVRERVLGWRPGAKTDGPPGYVRGCAVRCPVCEFPHKTERGLNQHLRNGWHSCPWPATTRACQLPVWLSDEPTRAFYLPGNTAIQGARDGFRSARRAGLGSPPRYLGGSRHGLASEPGTSSWMTRGSPRVTTCWR